MLDRYYTNHMGPFPGLLHAFINDLSSVYVTTYFIHYKTTMISLQTISCYKSTMIFYPLHFHPICVRYDEYQVHPLLSAASLCAASCFSVAFLLLGISQQIPLPCLSADSWLHPQRPCAHGEPQHSPLC